MRWNPIVRLSITVDWQFIPTATGNYFRIVHFSPPPNPNGWICRAQKLADNTYQIFDTQPFRPQGGVRKEVFKLDKPEFFADTYIGVRQKFNGANGWTIEIQEADLEATSIDEAPQTLFTNQIPSFESADNNYELGMKFQATKAGYIKAIRFWKPQMETGQHIGKIWTEDGTLLKSVTFLSETGSGWQQQLFTDSLLINASTTYIVSANNNSVYVYSRGNESLQNSLVNKDLFSVADGSNGVFGISGSFPTSSFIHSNYFRDVVFQSSE